MGSNWSYVLAGTLAFAWVFYITSKGELPAYLEVIGLINTPKTSTTQTPISVQSLASQPGALGASELGLL